MLTHRAVRFHGESAPEHSIEGNFDKHVRALTYLTGTGLDFHVSK